MTVEFDVNGARRGAHVRRDGDRWVVTLDGREFSASVARSGIRWSLLVSSRRDAQRCPVGSQPRPDTGGGGQPCDSHDVSIEAGPGGSRIVHVDGTAVPVTVVEPRSFRRRRGSDRTAAAGPARVIAPMPGRIVRVLVQRGDLVAARQPVVVIEAMKMENELRASRAGTVAEVRVAQGASVDAYAVLVVLE